ncbi:MAG TPA: Hsp20/alpha crystallin family protein [Candidatus Doudnabacteria bacterium]|nr:Hsp20/alpha crystallin family protein [Candidatus Doudnabacteria bacterium]
MARQKQSFFGKIMGGDVAQTQEEYFEEETLTPTAEQEITEEEPLEEEEQYLEEGDEEYYEDDEESAESESPQMPATKPAQVSTPISKQEEDWMTDYEGALNIDMYQTKDNVIIKSTIAGVRPDDIDITVANDMVTITGSRKREEKITEDDYFYQECYWGGFSRSVIVPVDIDSEQIEADLKDGILTVVIPKAAKAKTKKVKVKGL